MRSKQLHEHWVKAKEDASDAGHELTAKSVVKTSVDTLFSSANAVLPKTEYSDKELERHARIARHSNNPFR